MLIRRGIDEYICTLFRFLFGKSIQKSSKRFHLSLPCRKTLATDLIRPMVRLYSWICWMISSRSLSVIMSKSANVSACGERDGQNKLHGHMRSVNCLEELLNVKHTWFLSDMRKSSLDPGSPSSMKVLTNRRSALFPAGEYIQHRDSTMTVLLCGRTKKKKANMYSDRKMPHHQARGHTLQDVCRLRTPHRPPREGSRADLMPGEECRCTS